MDSRRWIRCVAILGFLVLLILPGEGTSDAAEATSPPVVLLWPDGAPGAVGNEDKDKPTLTIFAPPADKANGCAVVICPGGGYGHLAVDHEGFQVGQWLNSFGVTGVMLKYRIAPAYRHPAPMQDVQRAIRTVRYWASRPQSAMPNPPLRLDPARIGVMGFSAGGHLASTAATHFDSGRPEAADPIERMSCRPDFAILVYPVISFTTEYAHKGSRANLLGKDPDPKLVEWLSNELHVTPETPPTFLIHTGGDTGVPAENSVLFYLALRKAKVPAELHIYEKGPHGFGLGRDAKRGDPVLATWPDRCQAWMGVRGLLEKK
ncbi:MAG: alpha/beta hydrolase [Candidatus Sumerlaeia bacterium]|nr:alpha/beta hydrolase [Candidatus Sumerlaeia bacterium]